MSEEIKPFLCPKCGSDKVIRAGKKRGRQIIHCKTCARDSIVVDGGGGPAVSTAPVRPEGAGFVMLAKVIEKYDIAAAIRRELAVLPKGRLILETELCQKTAGTDRNRFRRTVENNAEAFRAYRIKLRLDDGEPKWYWGGMSDIEEATRICNG